MYRKSLISRLLFVSLLVCQHSLLSMVPSLASLCAKKVNETISVEEFKEDPTYTEKLGSRDIRLLLAKQWLRDRPDLLRGLLSKLTLPTSEEGRYGKFFSSLGHEIDYLEASERQDELEKYTLGAYGMHDGSISYEHIMYKGKTNKLVFKDETIEGLHEAVINSVRFDRSLKRLLTASEDKMVKVWDREGGHNTIHCFEHPSEVENACFTANEMAVVSFTDTTMRIWDLELNACIFERTFNKSIYGGTLVSEDNRLALLFFDLHVYQDHPCVFIELKSVFDVQQLLSNSLTIEQLVLLQILLKERPETLMEYKEHIKRLYPNLPASVKELFNLPEPSAWSALQNKAELLIEYLKKVRQRVEQCL